MTATSPETDLITCKCNHCSGHIQFDPAEMEISGGSSASSMGPTITCPHCGLDTILYIPPAPKPKPAPEKTEPIQIPEPPRKRSITLLGPIILLLIGIALVANGCFMDS